MRKLIIASSLLMGALFSNHVEAQTDYCGITLTATSGLQVNSMYLPITSTQTEPPTSPQNTPYVNDLSGDYNLAGGTGTILAGLLYYWNDPSITSILNFSIPSTAYATIENTSSTALTVWIAVAANNSSTVAQGAFVHIPWQGTATVYFPASGGRFTAASQLGAADPYDLGYPGLTMPLQIIVESAPASN